MTDLIASQYLIRPDKTISTTDQVAYQYLVQPDHLNIQPVYFPTEAIPTDGATQHYVAMPRSADPVYIANNLEQTCCCVLL